MTLDFKNIISILGVLCLFVFSGCAKDLAPPEISSLNQHFENEYFSIDIPWGWKVYESTSRSGNLHFDLLDPHYPKFRIRISIAKDAASLSDDSSEVSVWGRICLFFSDLFSKNFAVKARSTVITQINGKRADIYVVNTDEFAGYVATISGELGTYDIYYWLWEEFPQETKDRIGQIIYSIRVP
jgi:hypothetical protein